MLDDFSSFDQAFPQIPAAHDSPARLPALRLRKGLKRMVTFWGSNMIFMPLLALAALTIAAEGLRQTTGIFALPLSRMPIPGAGLLAHYDGWNRLDLSMLVAFIAFVAVTLTWTRIFRLLMGSGRVLEHRARNPVLFYLLAGIAAIIILGDCAIFYIGLESKAASGWSDTPTYTPAVATIFWAAALAGVGAWHADYHTQGIV